jgi:hypothetical protein
MSKMSLIAVFLFVVRAAMLQSFSKTTFYISDRFFPELAGWFGVLAGK